MTAHAAKPRMTVLTQWFEPEPAYRGVEFAHDLRSRGFEVDVVTGFPNYPGGKLYDGYRLRPKQVEGVRGIPVTRLMLYPSHDHSSFGRALNYLSFMLSASLFLLLRRRTVDMVYVYHPPITVGLAAVLAKLIRRYRVVIEIQDLWPDSLVATGMFKNARALSVLNAVCNFVYRHANRIVVQSEGFRSRLIERNVAADKVVTIRNWAPDDVRSTSAAKLPLGYRENDVFRVVFAGNMGKAQALDSALVAAQLVERAKPGVTFYFIGGGTERSALEDTARKNASANVVFLPRVPVEQIGAYLLSADALLVHLRDDPLFEITIPSKTQAYLSIGRPIIMAAKGEAAQLVTGADAGISVAPENPEALAAAILHLAEMTKDDRGRMGRRGAEFYHTTLSKDVGMRAFEDVFLKVRS
jgi:colanic acid biosynthesis glycosyl transferase WcaI